VIEVQIALQTLCYFWGKIS